MWIQAGRHRLISAHPARLDTIQLRPITHSDCFGLFFKGKEEQMVNLGEDLDKAEAILAKVAAALGQGQGYLDLSPDL
jgi:hypothetical protein